MQVKEEPKDLYENTHIDESCVFCEKPTKFWHERTNNPVCRSCARTHKVSELINWRRNTKVQPLMTNNIEKFKGTLKDAVSVIEEQSKRIEDLKAEMREVAITAHMAGQANAGVYYAIYANAQAYSERIKVGSDE